MKDILGDYGVVILTVVLIMAMIALAQGTIATQIGTALQGIINEFLSKTGASAAGGIIGLSKFPIL